MAGTMCAGGKGKTSSLPALTITIAAPAFRPCHTGKQDNSRPPPKPSKPAATAAAPRGWRYTEHQHSRLEGPSLPPSEKPQHTTRPLTPNQLALRQHRNRHILTAVTKPSTMVVTSSWMNKRGKRNKLQRKPKRSQQATQCATWRYCALMPALMDTHSQLLRNSRAGIG
ncbi:Hypothetical predicted protein [Pelobates cultripes]|uniref:Uncharacterized protein n=1 Tax=Pelobates cultripes TaxID=61616 RepID=A0AAD1S640_PELCU|nr:Hypothetical predicted protein [Pelobates cultripes]